MIGYRFLPPAEEEMVEASLFYAAESSELGFILKKRARSWWSPLPTNGAVRITGAGVAVDNLVNPVYFSSVILASLGVLAVQL